MEVSLSKKEEEVVENFLKKKNLPLNRAVTFDDVALPEKYSDIRSRSEINNFKTNLIQGELDLNIPFISANMESVTGAELIIALQREGGLGILPQTLPTEEKAKILEKVKRDSCARIEKPITISPDSSMDKAKEKMSKFNINTLIVSREGRLIGILSKRDWFYGDQKGKVEEFMSSNDLITAPEDIDFEKARTILKENKIEKLPLVDEKNNLKGLMTARGLFYKKNHPKALRNKKGQFIRTGAIGVGRKFGEKRLEDVRKQKEKGIQALLIDTARANSINTKDAIEKIKSEFPDMPLIAGNVSTPEGAKFLFDMGVDTVKVGVGPGSACTTRETGIGVPQLTAVAKCASLKKLYDDKRIIADGGISSAGDAAKALIGGADALMIGSLLAGTEESAARSYSTYIEELSAEVTVKDYEGSASFAAQKKRANRDDLDKIRRPEGIKKQVPVVGTVKDRIGELLDGLRSSMSYLGVRNLKELKENGSFLLQTSSGFSEGVDVHN
ncbi:MAG: IMP dehydrogenase [Candidatus Magasanikbacteria bacterium]